MQRAEALTGSLPLRASKTNARSFAAAAHPCARNTRRAPPQVVPALQEGLALDAAAASTASIAYGEGEPLPAQPSLLSPTVATDWPRGLRFASTACTEEILANRRGVTIVAAGHGFAAFKDGIVQKPWFSKHFGPLLQRLPADAPRRVVALDPDMESWHLPPRTSTAAPDALQGIAVERHLAAAWPADGFVSFGHRPWTSNMDGARTPLTTSVADVAFSPFLQRLALPTAIASLSSSEPAGLPTTNHTFSSHANHRTRFAATYRTVAAFDVARVVEDAARDNAFVSLFLDADGMEWAIAERLARTGMWGLVDEVFIECHNGEWMPNWPTRHSPADCHRLLNTLRAQGVYAHEWYD